jgi:high-affinity iron transporter
VAVVVGLAVLREGAEIVLFLYGMVAGSGGWRVMLSGSAVGLGLGAVMGAALYLGLLRIPLRHLFAVTSWMILLLAAGMAAQGAKYLVQADVLPPLGLALWDTSAVLSEDSLIGQTLHTLIGYSSRPSGMQLVAYLAALLGIGGLMLLFADRRSRPLS